MISDNFANTNIRHGCQNISYNGNNRSCHFNVFREETILEGKTQLVNHKDTNTIVTRMSVTSSRYRRWSEAARSLSNAMTVTFMKDAKAKRYIKYERTIKTVGQKKAKSSPLDAIFNITGLIIAVISCEHNPTARSEKSRLSNSFLTVGGIVEFFINAND